MNKVLYFTNPGCGVCVDLLPKVKALVEGSYPKLDFEVVDIVQKPEMAGQYTVFASPTILVFFDGKETHRFVRNLSMADFDNKLNRLYSLFYT